MQLRQEAPIFPERSTIPISKVKTPMERGRECDGHFLVRCEEGPKDCKLAVRECASVLSDGFQKVLRLPREG